MTQPNGGAPPEKSFTSPDGLRITVKMVGPYAADADLQVICVFKHKKAGDIYQDSMQVLDDKLGGLVSRLRNSGDFVGELGETFLFSPPSGSIPAKRLLMVGLGDEAALSSNAMGVAARVALREAVRLRVKQVYFAPTLRDQGSSKLGVGEVDSAVVSQILRAYDAELRLQQQKLSPEFRIEEWIIEAGPKYFDDAVNEVGKAVAAASVTLQSSADATATSASKP
jgi:hypothetical protein